MATRNLVVAEERFNGSRVLRGPGGCTVSVEDVDAAKAGAWLESMGNNRKVKLKTLAKMIADMKNGRWYDNGAPFRFYNKVLADGQHRCLSIVETGYTIRDAIVIRDMSEMACRTVDANISPRTPADVLHMLGYKNSREIVSSVRYPWLYDADMLDNYDAVTFMSPTSAEIESLVKRYAGLPELVSETRNTTSIPKILRRSIFTGLWYLAQRDPDGDEWFRSVFHGTNMQEGDPALVLRDRLIRETTRTGMSSIRAQMYLYLVVRSWNAHVAGEKISKLQVSDVRALPKMRIRAANLL